MRWPGVFQSVTLGGWLGFWKCRSHRERAWVTHSPSGHTRNFPGRSCSCCWPEALLGTRGPLWVSSSRLSPSFLCGLAWYFFGFFLPSPFPFALLGNRLN